MFCYIYETNLKLKLPLPNPLKEVELGLEILTVTWYFRKQTPKRVETQESRGAQQDFQDLNA